MEHLEKSRNAVYGKVLNRLDRVEDGNFADCRHVGQGVWELRIDFGPGYRVYFGEDDDLAVLLLGGTKKTQVRDIKTAKKYWSDYNA
jgi:putative addiction module killer protein